MSSSPQAGVQPLQMYTQTSTSGSQARKRTRGPNRCIALNHQQEHVVLRLNEFGQPIGASARLLSSFLGIIARDEQKAPINYFDWRKMPRERKTDMWRAVLSKFEIATDEQTPVKKWVFSKICQFWKNWKSKLKKTNYDPFYTIRERLQYRPDRVDPVQWVLLSEFLGTKDEMERSKRNAENRIVQTMNHTAGTKSFAQKIAADQRVVAVEERMGRMEARMNQMMTCFQMFTQHGQPSSSFEPVFSAPPDIQRDV